MRSIEIKAALIMAFLFMILMRLVWMDTRSYVLVYAPENHRMVMEGTVCQKGISHAPSDHNQGRPSWGDSWLYHVLLRESCRSGSFSENSFVRFNQGFLLLTIIACMIFARIVARSWIVALLVGLALLSRGRLIASSGMISGDHMIMFGLSVWAMFIAHWIRSGSRLIFAAISLTLLWLVDLEFSFIMLAFVPPIYAWVARSKKVRAMQPILEPQLFWPKVQTFFELQNFFLATSEQPTGGIFRPLAQTFAIPLREDSVYRKFLKDFVTGFAALLVFTLLIFFLRSYGGLRLNLQMTKITLWSQLLVMPVDRDIILSIVSIGLSVTLRTFVLPALRGLNLSIMLGVFLGTIGVLLIDHIYLPAEATGYWLAPQVILWWEPLILALGVLGSYHFILCLGHWAWRRWPSSPATL